MNDQRAEHEVQMFGAELQPRQKPDGETEVREMKVYVALEDSRTLTRFFTAEYPCSLDTMLKNVKAVADELSLQTR